jgi:ArsR family transcriptional regulator
MMFKMFQFMTLTKAMTDENRVRILMALSTADELCVCHINELLGLEPSTVSKHWDQRGPAGRLSLSK